MANWLGLVVEVSSENKGDAIDAKDYMKPLDTLDMSILWVMKYLCPLRTTTSIPSFREYGNGIEPPSNRSECSDTECIQRATSSM